MSRKKSDWFSRIGKLVVFGALFGVFATYMGWLRTDTSVDVNSDKAIHDTKHFIKRVKKTTQDAVNGN